MARPPESLLRVSMVSETDRVALRLEGELDCASAEQLQQVVDELWRTNPPSRVVIEAEGLTFLDVAGLKPLLSLAGRLPSGGVQLRNARRPVVRVLRLLDLAGELGLDG